MKSYLVIYNLTSITGKINVSRIESTVKSYGAWAKLMDNAWIIKTSVSRSSVAQIFGSIIGPGDKFIIIEVANSWNSYNLPKDVINWLTSSLQ